jgi:signal transduction histidine kinase
LIDVTRAQMDSFAIEYRITRPDGSERWCRSRGGATRDATGQTVRVVGTLLDVTDEVAGRMVVAELQRQIEESQRMARIGSWSWNMITGEVLWSAETYRLLEFDPSHTPSFQSVLDLAINDEQRARFLELVQDAIAGTRPYDFEISIRLQDGSLRHLHNYGTVERASDGAPIRMTGVFKDITVERQAALEREALQLKMQQSQKLESLGLLAGGIAHDFNNMLVGVLTNANSILLEAGPDAAHRTAVEEIERAGQRASELTRQLLAYSGRARFVVEPVNLSALTLEMTQLLRAALSAGARLDLQLVDDLPLVMGDATQLRQVVMNLITNASDALLEQSGVITLRTSVSSDTRVGDGVVSFGEHATAGPFVVLEVADTGTGMPPETVQRIFDPFFTTKFTGRGLGLAGSLGIMRAHGGRILVASRAGDGTTFRLELPVYEAAATTTPSGGIASAERRDASSPISDLMVLVVDDDPTVRNVIERTLLRMGHRVTMAGGGREALSALDEGLVPDLILLDLTMPEMGGREVLREIAKRDAGHKVVLVSGYNEIDLIADTSEPSLAGFLRKPFTVAELAGVIRESLR